MPALLPNERHNNRSPGTKKPVISEPDVRHKPGDIQNEILIEVVETNVLQEPKSDEDSKHNTGKFSFNKGNNNTSLLEKQN